MYIRCLLKKLICSTMKAHIYKLIFPCSKAQNFTSLFKLNEKFERQFLIWKCCKLQTHAVTCSLSECWKQIRSFLWTHERECRTYNPYLNTIVLRNQRNGLQKEIHDSVWFESIKSKGFRKVAATHVDLWSFKKCIFYLHFKKW